MSIQEEKNIKNDDHVFKLSEKQKTFIIITQINIILFSILSIFSCVYFFPTFKTNNDDINQIYDRIPSENDLANYFKNNDNKISNDCLSFDGHTLNITAPMILSDTALQKMQFKNGLKLNGMTITPSSISLSKKLLFNNNMNIVSNNFSGIGGDITSVIFSSFNSHFFGEAGLTEIGLSTTPNSCQRSSTKGSLNNPFPGLYISGTKLCLCLQNWIYRYNTHTINDPLTFALNGNQDYDTPGEYCVSLTMSS